MTNRFRLGDIAPNPFRNIERYPINPDKVAKLKESIGRTDFWDNLVARIGPDGKPEIAYGHHRMVALRELFPPDHKISLIVRDLDDEAMLHIMADENMQEWSTTSAVIVETVRAVRDYLAVSAPERERGHGARDGKPDNAKTITTFLGWPEGRVDRALAILNAEEAGLLAPEDTADLDIEQATVMRQSVSRIKDPAVRAQAISRVRADLADGRIGKRGIPDVVHEVRTAAHPPEPEPVLPSEVAGAIWKDIDGFWRVGVRVDGRAYLTRAEVIRLIAANRNTLELRHDAVSIANALDRMAETASELSAALRAEGLEVTA